MKMEKITKNSMIVVAVIVSLFVCIKTQTVFAKSSDGFTMSDNVVTGYTGSSTNVTLPKNAKSVGAEAIQSSKIQKLTVPGNVTEISYCAFGGNTALENVVLKEGVKTIGSQAFLTCKNLKSITIPKSVKTIYDEAIGYESKQMDDYYWTSVKSQNLPTINCYANSAAYKYAVENGIPYNLLKESTSSNVTTKKLTGVPTKIKLKKGKNYKLSVKVSPASSTDKITYKTSNKKVAAVTSKGVIKAKKKGTATITVKSGKVTKKVKVTVK